MEQPELVEKARDILARAYEARGWPTSAAGIRRGESTGEVDSAPMRAVLEALTTTADAPRTMRPTDRIIYKRGFGPGDGDSAVERVEPATADDALRDDAVSRDEVLNIVADYATLTLWQFGPFTVVRTKEQKRLLGRLHNAEMGFSYVHSHILPGLKQSRDQHMLNAQKLREELAAFERISNGVS